MTLDVILKEIQKAEKIVILTHEAPDGDAIGSSLGLKLSLEKIGKKSDLIMTKHARTFDFLPASNEIKMSFIKCSLPFFIVLPLKIIIFDFSTNVFFYPFQINKIESNS